MPDTRESESISNLYESASRLLDNDRDAEKHDELPPYSENDSSTVSRGNGRLPHYTLVNPSTTIHTQPESNTRFNHERTTERPLRNNLITHTDNNKRKYRQRMAIVLICAILIAVGIAGGVIGSRHHHDSDEDSFNVTALLENATHKVSQVYEGSQFLDAFDFFTDAANETYDSRLVDQTTSLQEGIVEAQNSSSFIMRVKNDTSVRLVSKESWSSGIFVFELNEIPRYCRYTPFIYLSQVGNTSPNNALTLYQLQAESYSSLNTHFEYWYFGYRTPVNNSCQVTVRSTNGKTPLFDCHAENSTTAPVNCGYDFAVRSTSDYLLLIVELNSEKKQMRIWNTVLSDTTYSRDWLQQINASAIDITRPYWQRPDTVFEFGQECNTSNVFKDLRLVMGTNVCGDYGQYYWNVDESETSFTDGAWCASACGSGEVTDDYVTRTTKWDIKRVSVFQPV